MSFDHHAFPCRLRSSGGHRSYSLIVPTTRHGAASRRLAAHHRAGVGPHRVHRLRWAARAHHAVPRAVRNTPGMADRGSVRARDRGDQPAARTGLDTARDLLRLAAARPPGGAHRRTQFHSARAGGDPRALRAVPLGIAAHVDSGRRDGSRRSSRRRRDQGRAGRGRANLETHDRAAAAPHPPLRARGRGRGGHDGSVARTHPVGVRCD